VLTAKPFAKAAAALRPSGCQIGLINLRDPAAVAAAPPFAAAPFIPKGRHDGQLPKAIAGRYFFSLRHLFYPFHK
jgi:hypothetical protein